MTIESILWLRHEFPRNMKNAKKFCIYPTIFLYSVYESSECINILDIS